MKNRIKLLICILVFAFGTAAGAFSSGPIPGRTGAPDEPTCVDCHDSFELNRGPGRVEILDLPKTYSLGQSIRVRVSVRQARQKRWGFQITALDKSGRFAGQFAVTDPNRTQIIAGDNRMYVEHTLQGTSSATPDSAEWTFDWTAPNTDVGPVVFYAAGNAANGDNIPLGDFIYTTAAQIGGSSDPVVTLAAPNGGETINGGDVFTISWSSINATSHDVLLQLNGTNDIPKSIASGLAGDVQEFKWSVPNDLSTARGRIIIVAQGREGRADSDASDRDFTIVPTQAIPGPVVSSVEVTEKKIKTVGSGFITGATVTVNGIGFSSAAAVKGGGTKMIQKGTATNGNDVGQLIPKGVRVRLVFANPDGGVTAIDYVRP